MDTKKISAFAIAAAACVMSGVLLLGGNMFARRASHDDTYRDDGEGSEDSISLTAKSDTESVNDALQTEKKDTSLQETFFQPETAESKTELPETMAPPETTASPPKTTISSPDTTIPPETTASPLKTTAPHETTSSPPETTPPETTPPPKYMLCEADGDVDMSLLTVVDAELSQLPEGLINCFTEYGWHICVTDKNLSEYFFGGAYERLVGTTSMRLKTIYLSDSETSIKWAALHEFGHFVDIIYGYYHLLLKAPCSNHESFMLIYEKESDVFLAATGYSHSTYDNVEFFGEAFKEYIKRPDFLNEVCPETYSFIDAVVSILCE